MAALVLPSRLLVYAKTVAPTATSVACTPFLPPPTDITFTACVGS